jgi:CO dehydrogenase/acetyl-CoA synthase beta subunit
MELFDSTIQDIRSFVAKRQGKRTWNVEAGHPWPEGGDRNIVLKEDMGLELGSPDGESLSSILWTGTPGLIQDGSITLVGPDISESHGGSLPFAKVVLAGVSGFTDENAYERYRDMELIRYTLDLRGYMLRAVSQYQREWCRISRDAIDDGFSFDILGAALIEMFREKPYVNAVEILYVTSSPEDVWQLKDITKDTSRMIGAMHKMAEEEDFDCDTCEYQDVCDDAGELKKMREARMRKVSGGSR